MSCNGSRNVSFVAGLVPHVEPSPQLRVQQKHHIPFGHRQTLTVTIPIVIGNDDEQSLPDTLALGTGGRTEVQSVHTLFTATADRVPGPGPASAAAAIRLWAQFLRVRHVAGRLGEHVRADLPTGRRFVVLRRRNYAQRKTGCITYVALFGVRRLDVQPMLVLEHRIHYHSEGQIDLRLVPADPGLVEHAGEGQDHGNVGGLFQSCLKNNLCVNIYTSISK